MNTDHWRQQQEQEEQEQSDREIALDLDAMSSADSEWWREQDAELTAEELQTVESLAEIQEYRTQGYM